MDELNFTIDLPEATWIQRFLKKFEEKYPPPEDEHHFLQFLKGRMCICIVNFPEGVAFALDGSDFNTVNPEECADVVAQRISASEGA